MRFDSFLGNAKTVATVRSMLASGRAPGAMLFSGPDGVGKKTLALMLAKAINCKNRGPRGDDFCGECASCRKADEMLAASGQDLARRRELKNSQQRVDDLVYFDLQLIEPITRYILIEQIRQLLAAAYTRPFELSHRVFVIDQAQAIHWQAADLLLKILEEPPATTTLILVCPNPHEMRATIRSRCLHLALAPLEDSIIERLLIEEAHVAKPQMELAVRVAAGSVARAKSFDAADYQRRRRPWLDFIAVIAEGRLASSSGGAWEKLLEAAKVLTAERAEFEASLEVGYILLRDLLHAAAGEQGLTNVDLAPQIHAWSKHLGFRKIEKLTRGLDQAYRLQSRNANQQIAFETLAASLSMQ